MGSRGPGKMPTPLKILRGTDRADRRPSSEPKPRSGRPRMPIDLSPSARRVWRRVMLEMGQTGVITPADGDVLRLYCEAMARYVQAAQLLEESGPIIHGQRGTEMVKSPLNQIVRDNAALVRALARELGLTPSARAGMSTGNQAEAADPFEQFLRGEAEA